MIVAWLLVASLGATTFTQGISTPLASLNPFAIASIDAFAVTSQILETLARVNPRTGELEPVLARKWTHREGKVRVHLREGVLFHNGQKLSSEDVRFTLAAYAQPEYRAEIWRGMWKGVGAIRVMDPLQFEIEVDRYQSFEAFMTSLRILPKSFYEPYDRDKFRDQIVGSGPYRLKKFNPNRSVELAAFDHWWGKRPSADLLIKTVAAPEELLSKNELDFFGPTPPTARTKALPSGLGQGMWIDLNLRLPQFQSVEVREALQLLWRRDELNQKVFGGRMKLALDIFSPTMRDYPSAAAAVPNLARARELLKNRKVEFTLLVKTDEQSRWATLYQNDAARAGVTVHIYKVANDEQWLKRMAEGKFEAAAGGGGLINEATTKAWHSQGPYNYAGFSDRQVDRWTEQLDREFDLAKRRLILRKLILRIRELRPQVAGLASLDEYFLISPRLVVDKNFPTRTWVWKLR